MSFERRCGGRLQVGEKKNGVEFSIFVVLERIGLNRLEVDEQGDEAAVPICDLTLVASFFRLFNLLIELVEGDDVAEEVLEPGREEITKVVELGAPVFSIHVELEEA